VQEHSKVLILGESVSEDEYAVAHGISSDGISSSGSDGSGDISSINRAPRRIAVPWRSVGWFHNRMVVKDFKAIFEITSPTSAKVSDDLSCCCLIIVSAKEGIKYYEVLHA